MWPAVSGISAEWVVAIAGEGQSSGGAVGGSLPLSARPDSCSRQGAFYVHHWKGSITAGSQR